MYGNVFFSGSGNLGRAKSKSILDLELTVAISLYLTVENPAIDNDVELGTSTRDFNAAAS